MTEKANYQSATPYLAAYILLRRDNNVAMVLRANTGWKDGHWGVLAGKVEWGESYSAAAMREAKEEGGVTIAPEDLQLKLIAQRHSDDSDWVDAVFEATKWEGEAYNAEPHVHEKLEWFDMNQLPENIVPAVKLYINAIAEGKTYLEAGW